MVSLKLQKRLAASIMSCGKGKVWLDPNESTVIGKGNSRKNVRKLIKDGYIVKKPNVVHSRFRVNRRAEAKAKGRHCGYGKRRGTREARFPTKIMWIRRMRVLRRFLTKYRAQSKIDRHLHQELYQKCKGNVFKSKKVLMEHIHLIQAEKAREKALLAEATARRERLKAKKAKAAARAE
jgi:large subunit ribosomal protein L19e